MKSKFDTSSSSSSIGFGGFLTLAFIVLRLTHVIDWSWWWVFAPMWIPVVTILCIMSLFGLIAVLIAWPGRHK